MFCIGILMLTLLCGDLNLDEVELRSLRIVDIKEIDGGLNPSFSPIGDKLLYEKEVFSPLNEIWIMDVESGERRCIGNGRNPKFSPRGNKILYEGGVHEENDGIWRMNSDGTDARLLVKNEKEGFYIHPNWLGYERIVFALYDEVEERGEGLFASDDTGYNRVQLTQNGINPTPSPGGTHIAFWVNELRGKNGLWVIDHAGKLRHLVIEHYKPDTPPPSICWGEEKVLYAKDSVWLLDVKLAKKNLISKKGYCASFSQNFKLIAYIDEDGLWIVDSHTKERVFLREAKGGEPIQIDWSPSGRYIAYSYLSPGGKPKLSLAKLGVLIGEIFVVSCGKEQGVKKGMKFRVYGWKTSSFTGDEEKGEFKGEIEIKDVFSERSICIRRKPGYLPIRVGDFVEGKFVKGFITESLGDSLR
jgi:Tol biopolymer transport system component